MMLVKFILPLCTVTIYVIYYCKKLNIFTYTIYALKYLHVISHDTLSTFYTNQSYTYAYNTLKYVKSYHTFSKIAQTYIPESWRFIYRNVKYTIIFNIYIQLISRKVNIFLINSCNNSILCIS